MGFIAQKLPGLNWRKARQPRRQPAGRGRRVPWLVLIGAALLTVFLGMVTALGAIKLTVALAGLMVAVPILFLVPTRVMLPTIFVWVFLVQGTLGYFFQFILANWMASMFCALFFVRALLELSNRPRLEYAPSNGFPAAGAVVAAAVIYLLFYAFSLSLTQSTLMQTISAVRFCLPMFGILFALYWFRWDESGLMRLWWMMVLIMLVQVPFVAYQHLFLMSSFGWDGVNGTFGKNMSAILVLFTLGTTMYVLSRWSRGLTSLAVVIPVCLVATVIILLGEVKAVLFWMPIGVFWVLRRRLLRNVIALLTFVFLSLAFITITYTAYKAMYWHANMKDDTMAEKLDSISGYVVDPSNINYRTGEISRGAALVLWYQDVLPTPMERIIGYGPGASASSNSTGLGVVAKRYRPLGISTTGAAMLLWDVGIAGFVTYVAFLGIGVAAGYRFVRRGIGTPAMMSAVDTSTGIVALLLTTIVYNRTLVDEATVQLFCFFCLGMIVQAWRFHGRAPAGARTAKAAPPAVHVVPAT